jgi:hypothetical protein
MPDIVQANEFVFTPSAFVCAYIEQKTPSETVTETNVFGAIDRDIQPKTISNFLKKDGLSFTSEDSGVQSNIGETISILGIDNTVIASPAGSFLSYPSFNRIEGIDERMNNVATISGSISDIAGQEYNEAQRTDSKTTVKTVEELATVVLVLSYGEYRAKCSNPQGTVNSIYTQVLAYFNSL